MSVIEKEIARKIGGRERQREGERGWWGCGRMGIEIEGGGRVKLYYLENN